ncbi:50S ribosomal protein L31, partial [Streptomyces sp. NPDC002740]
VDVSSASHPFYTGTSRVVDTAGRVERFERRYGRTATAAALAPATAPAPATASARS